MSKITSIKGFDVKKIDKNRYAVSVNNGNYGATILNKEQLQVLADTYGVDEKKSTRKKVFAGLAVLTGVGLVALGLLKGGKVVNKPEMATLFSFFKNKKIKVKKGNQNKGFKNLVKGLMNRLKNVFKSSVKLVKKVLKGFKNFVDKIFNRVSSKKSVKKSKPQVSPFAGKTVFARSFSSETENIKNNELANVAKKIGLLGPSGKTTMMWYNELQDVFGNGKVKHVKPRG